MGNEEKDLGLIGKKLTNSLTEKEEAIFAESMKNHDFRELYRGLDNIWKGSRQEYTAQNPDKAFDHILYQLQNEKTENPKSVLDKKMHWWLPVVGVAAVFALLMVFLFAAHWQVDSTPSNATQIIKSTQRGHKMTIVLPDNSKVKLNSESSIAYSSVFGGDKREVRLIGEAYFDVENDKDRPFIVKTDYMDIRVLGTSFNVKASEKTDNVKVSLTTGLVEVYENKLDAETTYKTSLSAGQAISYHKSNGSFDDITLFNPDAEYGWKSGLLYFDKASFTEVVSRLSSWYDVDFDIRGEPKKNWKYSGEFDNYPLEHVLHALSFTEKMEYNLEGKKVKINL